MRLLVATMMVSWHVRSAYCILVNLLLSLTLYPLTWRWQDKEQHSWYCRETTSNISQPRVSLMAMQIDTGPSIDSFSKLQLISIILGLRTYYTSKPKICDAVQDEYWLSTANDVTSIPPCAFSQVPCSVSPYLVPAFTLSFNFKPWGFTAQYGIVRYRILVCE